MPYKNKLKKIYIYNRWKNKYPPDDWTIFGVSTFWNSSEYYQYRICLFGIQVHIGIERIFEKL